MLPMGIAQNRFSVNGSIARGIIQPALLMKWVGTSDHFSHLGISSSCYERICLKNKPPAMVICKAMYHLSLNSFSFLSFQGTNQTSVLGCWTQGVGMEVLLNLSQSQSEDGSLGNILVVPCGYQDSAHRIIDFSVGRHFNGSSGPIQSSWVE